MLTGEAFLKALTTVFKILQSRFRENWDLAFLAKKIFHGSLGTNRSTNLFLMIVTVYATYCGYPADNYVFNVNNSNARTRCEIIQN